MPRVWQGKAPRSFLESDLGAPPCPAVTLRALPTERQGRGLLGRKQMLGSSGAPVSTRVVPLSLSSRAVETRLP